MLLHRFIMNATTNPLLIDHKNHDRLDNRKRNLHFVTSRLNSQRRAKAKNATSSYYGVFWSKLCNKWIASCAGYHIGLFQIAEWAAYAYDMYVLEVFGDTGQTNGLQKPKDFIMPKKNMPKYVQVDGKDIRGLTINRHSEGISYMVRWTNKATGKTYCKAYRDLQEAFHAHAETHRPLPKTNINIERNQNGIAVLPCTGSFGVLVDDDVYLKYHSQKCWLGAGGYPAIAIGRKPKPLHRIIMKTKTGEICDHKNRKRMDARRNNLRNVSADINSHNRTVSKSKISSSYMGVFKTNDDNAKYMAQVIKDGKLHHGGTYIDEKVAAFAADMLYQELFGEDARQNNIPLDAEYIFKDRRAIKCSDIQKYDIQPSKYSSNRHIAKSKKGSRFMGVYFKQNRYVVEMFKNKTRYYGGRYQDENVAAFAAEYACKRTSRKQCTPKSCTAQ